MRARLNAEYKRAVSIAFLATLILTIGIVRPMSSTAKESNPFDPGVISPSQYYWSSVASRLPMAFKRAREIQNLFVPGATVWQNRGELYLEPMSGLYRRSDLLQWSSKGDQIAYLLLANFKSTSQVPADSSDSRKYFELAATPIETLCTVDAKCDPSVVLLQFPNGIPDAHFALYKLLSKSENYRDRLEANGHLLLAAQNGLAAAWTTITTFEPPPGPTD